MQRSGGVRGNLCGIYREQHWHSVREGLGNAGGRRRKKESWGSSRLELLLPTAAVSVESF